MAPVTNALTSPTSPRALVQAPSLKWTREPFCTFLLNNKTIFYFHWLIQIRVCLKNEFKFNCERVLLPKQWSIFFSSSMPGLWHTWVMLDKHCTIKGLRKAGTPHRWNPWVWTFPCLSQRVLTCFLMKWLRNPKAQCYPGTQWTQGET